MYAAPASASHQSDSGFAAHNNAYLVADGATSRNNNAGYYAGWNAVTSGLNTNANNAGNTTNYSPPTSGTPANNDAMTRWS
jgi:uncharacterized protein YjaZ